MSPIVEPDYDTIGARVYSRVVCAGNFITVTAAGHNRKRLKRSGFEMMSDIFNHGENLNPVNRLRQGERPLWVIQKVFRNVRG